MAALPVPDLRGLFRRLIPRDWRVGLMPFALVKYFAFASLALILLASIVLSWVLANNARTVLLQRSQAYSQLFAENLNRQVFLQFVLPTVVRYGRIALSDKRQFERLDRIVRNITRGMHIQSVTIYDSRENIISYSTISELVGRRNMGGIEYEKAKKGKNSFVLVSNGSLLSLLPGGDPIYCTLKSYVPFRQESAIGGRSGQIMGVIEVVQDLSADLRAIIGLQGRLILLSLLTLGVLFAILALIVVHANRVMAARTMERIRLEEQLQEAERLAALGKMVAAVSHEIKNPLGIVQSTAEILGKRIAKIAPGNERLAAIIVEETRRLDTIVREFLDFARPRELHAEPGNPGELVERLARFLEQDLAEKEIDLRVEREPDLPLVAMDTAQIYQVLLNMAINAVQAMEAGGTLTLSVGRGEEGGTIAFVVRDTGKGMSPETMAQIFDPFFTDKHRGTGLGLAIARNIVDKHGGRITVDSVQGQGTAFTVILPLNGAARSGQGGTSGPATGA